MKGKRMLTIPIITGVLAFVGGWAISAQDKYTVKVPNSKHSTPLISQHDSTERSRAPRSRERSAPRVGAACGPRSRAPSRGTGSTRAR